MKVGFQAAALSPLGQAWRAGWPGPECGTVSRPSSSSSGSPGPACPQLLNCIMDMAEKTRRSLTVLRRCQEADREELNHWIRRYSDAAEDSKKGPAPAARPLGSSVGAEGSQLGVLCGRARGTGAEAITRHGSALTRPCSEITPNTV